ncbi:hypothetical protein HQN60_02100 [Deefgea piscis]|uniref:Uncharacterized protein n=1 Tax=Deefgea piscis TaxID=2739061 RepID=A0A6M8SUT8_9NEIS|nr:hypothetical protein [Deefgea piscis]QKJ65627.1 hypothetical protein HQN60_02100 [Deefgea piscis]
MGKKSRLKKERRSHPNATDNQNPIDRLISLDNFNGAVYRFFPEEWQADELCNGNIWISTLESCRKYEDPSQGDSHEATQTYQSGHIAGGSNDLAFIEMASRSGISIGEGCSNITISNCNNTQKLSDAYVICTTKSFQPENLSDTFGKYCVKISNPMIFFRLVSLELNKYKSIREGAIGLIQYKDRHYTGLQPVPGPIGFIKPRDPYSNQNEFRFLWIPRNNIALHPFSLKCQSITKFCTRIK